MIPSFEIHSRRNIYVPQQQYQWRRGTIVLEARSHDAPAANLGDAIGPEDDPTPAPRSTVKISADRYDACSFNNGQGLDVRREVASFSPDQRSAPSMPQPT